MSGTMLKAIFYARFHEEKGMRRVLFLLMVLSSFLAVLQLLSMRAYTTIDGTILRSLLGSLRTGIMLAKRSRRQFDAAVVQSHCPSKDQTEPDMLISPIFPYQNSLI
jgi:hypothetical protein